MKKYCVFIALILGVSSFFVVNALGRNVSDVLDDIGNEIENIRRLKLEKTQANGLVNRSHHYDNECDCGLGSRACHYNIFNEKVCDCSYQYEQNYETGKCEYCYCGVFSSSCTFEKNQKVCSCHKNYLQDKYGKCIECDCGRSSRKCHFNIFNEKVCDCSYQYEQNDETGECEYCYCGVFSSKCTFENNQKVCSCYKNYLQDKYGICTECDCGLDAVSCRLDGSLKVCTCREGYIEKRGKCEWCDCGEMSTSCELTFDKYTRCTCKPGYVAQRSTWENNEYCKLVPESSGWRIATYIESVIFSIIILVCIARICSKKN